MDENLKNLLDTDIGKITEDGKKKSKKRKKVLIAVTAVTVFAIAIWTVVIPRVKMASALELMAAGKYEEARAMFEGKPDMLKECDYQWYKQQLEQGDCSADVKKGFKALGDYKDSQVLLKECDYQWYKQKLEQGDYSTEVQSGLSALDDYKDSAELAKETKYQRAIQFMNEGEYYSAYRLFDRVGDYKDAVANATEIKYSVRKGKV